MKRNFSNQIVRDLNKFDVRFYLKFLNYFANVIYIYTCIKLIKNIFYYLKINIINLKKSSTYPILNSLHISFPSQTLIK